MFKTVLRDIKNGTLEEEKGKKKKLNMILT